VSQSQSHSHSQDKRKSVKTSSHGSSQSAKSSNKSNGSQFSFDEVRKRLDPLKVSGLRNTEDNNTKTITSSSSRTVVQSKRSSSEADSSKRMSAIAPSVMLGLQRDSLSSFGSTHSIQSDPHPIGGGGGGGDQAPDGVPASSSMGQRRWSSVSHGPQLREKRSSAVSVSQVELPEVAVVSTPTKNRPSMKRRESRVLLIDNMVMSTSSNAVEELVCSPRRRSDASSVSSKNQHIPVDVLFESVKESEEDVFVARDCEDTDLDSDSEEEQWEEETISSQQSKPIHRTPSSNASGSRTRPRVRVPSITLTPPLEPLSAPVLCQNSESLDQMHSYGPGGHSHDYPHTSSSSYNNNNQGYSTPQARRQSNSSSVESRYRRQSNSSVESWGYPHGVHHHRSISLVESPAHRSSCFTFAQGETSASSPMLNRRISIESTTSSTANDISMRKGTRQNGDVDGSSTLSSSVAAPSTQCGDIPVSVVTSSTSVASNPSLSNGNSSRPRSLTPSKCEYQIGRRVKVKPQRAVSSPAPSPSPTPPTHQEAGVDVRVTLPPPPSIAVRSSSAQSSRSSSHLPVHFSPSHPESDVGYSSIPMSFSCPCTPTNIVGVGMRGTGTSGSVNNMATGVPSSSSQTACFGLSPHLAAPPLDTSTNYLFASSSTGHINYPAGSWETHPPSYSHNVSDSGGGVGGGGSVQPQRVSTDSMGLGSIQGQGLEMSACEQPAACFLKEEQSLHHHHIHNTSSHNQGHLLQSHLLSLSQSLPPHSHHPHHHHHCVQEQQEHQQSQYIEQGPGASRGAFVPPHPQSDSLSHHRSCSGQISIGSSSSHHRVPSSSPSAASSISNNTGPPCLFVENAPPPCAVQHECGCASSDVSHTHVIAPSPCNISVSQPSQRYGGGSSPLPPARTVKRSYTPTSFQVDNRRMNMTPSGASLLSPPSHHTAAPQHGYSSGNVSPLPPRSSSSSAHFESIAVHQPIEADGGVLYDRPLVVGGHGVEDQEEEGIEEYDYEEEEEEIEEEEIPSYFPRQRSVPLVTGHRHTSSSSTLRTPTPSMVSYTNEYNHHMRSIPHPSPQARTRARSRPMPVSTSIGNTTRFYEGMYKTGKHNTIPEPHSGPTRLSFPSSDSLSGSQYSPKPRVSSHRPHQHRRSVSSMTRQAPPPPSPSRRSFGSSSSSSNWGSSSPVATSTTSSTFTSSSTRPKSMFRGRVTRDDSLERELNRLNEMTAEILKQH